MQEFLIILKGDGMAQMGPEEMQQLLADYKSWVKELGQDYLAGQRLQNKGAVLQNNQVATDGPFLEPKEMIAGYFLIRAANDDHALEIARKAPHSQYYQLEIRPLVQPLMH